MRPLGILVRYFSNLRTTKIACPLVLVQIPLLQLYNEIVITLTTLSLGQQLLQYGVAFLIDIDVFEHPGPKPPVPGLIDYPNPELTGRRDYIYPYRHF